MRELDLPPLSPAADEALRRARVLLRAVHGAAHHTAVILQGYAEDIHAQGVGLVSWVSGEQSFSLWRRSWVLRPRRDPDLPDELARLSAFVARWRPLALAAVYQLALSPDDRDEVLGYLAMERSYPSTTWEARAWGQTLRGLIAVPTDAHQAVGRLLDARGFAGELAAMEVSLARVQQHLQKLPVDDEERRAIGEFREARAESLRHWLDERRTQFSSLGADRLHALGLGEICPALSPATSLSSLASFSMGAKA